MCTKIVLLTLVLVSAFAVPSVSYVAKIRMKRQYGNLFHNFYGNIYNQNANTQDKINSIIANTQNAINQQVQNIFNQANFPFGNMYPNYQTNFHNHHNQHYQHNQHHQHNHHNHHNHQNNYNNHQSQNNNNSNLNDNINNNHHNHENNYNNQQSQHNNNSNLNDNINNSNDNEGTDQVVWDEIEKMNPVGEDQYSIHEYVNVATINIYISIKVAFIETSYILKEHRSYFQPDAELAKSV
ncbi:PREDICTED: probable serine/threonine-protein kinase fhkB [Nicrophorus vespilloides]|uniref:Probable serine/threonine-protein kinase fhkB n=1 Tax=Nicrophorus vespilloides TaxID=110193 RepID=A0ABM1M6Y4_NICVS|nr:PREDICTED: probable serine/threonine-protein kinase fhkB [Nicrophorus vespilloides]